MRDWVGVSLAAKGSFLEEMRALLAGSEIQLFEIWSLNGVVLVSPELYYITT